MPSSLQSAATEVSRWAIAAWASRTWAFDSAKVRPPLRPPAVVVSICDALAGEHPQADAAGGQLLHGVDQMGEVAAQAVELPDDEHVVRPQRTQAVVESRPVVAAAGGAVVVDVVGVDALGPQGVALQVQRLGAIRLRDAGVADQHVS